MIINLYIILLVAFNYGLEKFFCKNGTYEVPKSINIKNCPGGFSGLNCTIATCSGYSLCNNESICIIKNTHHMCVCRYYDKNGIYIEIENCVRKFSILHGVCYMNSSAYSFCECEKGWIGYACEQKLFTNPILKKIDNILNNKLTSFRKSKVACKFYIEEVYYDKLCFMVFQIDHGNAYLVFPENNRIVVCEQEWCGDGTNCNTPCCWHSQRCKNSAVCYIEDNTYIRCRCLNGWMGSTCEKRCDICCYHGTVSYDEPNDRCFCICQTPYVLPDCLDPPNRKKFLSDEFMIQPCNNGYSGTNCSVATCSKYKSCINESICVIKDNKHLCVCSFFEKNGKYVELQNCIKKYLIQNGFCFSNTTGHKICNCGEGWSGDNCGKKLLSKQLIPSGFSRFLKNSKIKFGNFFKIYFASQAQTKDASSWPCGFYNEEGYYEDHMCTTGGYNITHGKCYNVLPDRHFVCSCDPGWSGKITCDKPSCYRVEQCINGGTCFIVDNKPKCSCLEGFYGENCSSKCLTCCGHGKAVYDYTIKTCVCNCFPPYSLPDCKDSPPTPPTTTTSTTTEVFSTDLSIFKNATTLGFMIGIPIFIVLVLVIIGIVIYRKKFQSISYRKMAYHMRNTLSRF